VLGWNLGVYRLPPLPRRDSSTPGREELLRAAREAGPRIAVWQTGIEGCDWLDRLVELGEAVDLGGDGYPNRYAATAKALLPAVLNGPPGAHETWATGLHDVVGPNWEGRTVVDRDAADACDPGEWLVVEAWDES
jgi:hypothetical protein